MWLINRHGGVAPDEARVGGGQRLGMWLINSNGGANSWSPPPLLALPVPLASLQALPPPPLQSSYPCFM